MPDLLFHPGLVLIAGALLLPWLRGRARSAAVLLIPLLALASVWQVPDGAAWQLRFLDYTLTPLQGDKLSRLFATIFSLMAFGGGLFALGQKSRVEIPAAFVYAGSAIGVALAGDLVTVFAFWELMAVGSTVVIWSQGSGASDRAARRYLMIHLFGGVLLFAGVTGHVAATGSVAFGHLQLDSPAHWLILAGFLVNAGAPPLSAWLPDAYPEASWSGTVFLSAFTTKTAVYVLIRGFAGTELLIWVGLFMVFYGIGLRAARERHAAHPGLLDRQPGGLHDHRHRHRHRAGIERRRGARLRAHRLQGLAADVGRLGALHDRAAQVLGAGRPVPQHAGGHRVRHDRRARHLGLSAHLGIRVESDDRPGRGRQPPACRLAAARRRVGRRLPARRHKVSRGSCSSRRTRGSDPATRRPACAGR